MPRTPLGELGVDFKVGIRNGAGPLPTGDPTGLGTGPQEYQLDRALDGVFNSFVAARGPVQGSQEFPAFIQEALASGFQEAKSNLPDALSPGANYARGVAIDKLEGALNTLLETVPVDVRDDARTEILTERAGMAAERGVEGLGALGVRGFEPPQSQIGNGSLQLSESPAANRGFVQTMNAPVSPAY